MNEYDSDKMADILAEYDNYEQIDQPELADVILFNTCSIREKAQEKVFSDLGRVRKLKQHKPNLIIGVGGCVASQEGDTILKRAPYVDIVFGPQTLHRIPDLMQQKNLTGKSQIDISFPEIEKFDKLPQSKTTTSSAYVSIMEGCSKYCSYCVVPYTRGEEVSRPFNDIMGEINTLTNNGVKEIHLLGQNVNAYRGALDDDIVDFAYLLEQINAIDAVKRIRFTTSHPSEMCSRIIECYTTLPKLVSHLHLPVQSGSDRILMAMKRGYTSLEYKSLIRKIRKARPGILFSSDFIVGFPGETEEEFNKTMQLIAEVGYDTSFSFIYSPRPGTPAADLKDEVSAATKLNRLNQLQKAIEHNVKQINHSLVGSIQKVLVDGYSKKDPNRLSGRADNFKLVSFEGNERLINTLVDVRITHAGKNALSGELVLL